MHCTSWPGCWSWGSTWCGQGSAIFRLGATKPSRLVRGSGTTWWPSGCCSLQHSISYECGFRPPVDSLPERDPGTDRMDGCLCVDHGTASASQRVGCGG